MHNLFSVCFVNLYMFQAHQSPSSGGTTVCIQQLVLIILFRWLPVGWIGTIQPTGSHLKRIISSTSTCSGRTKAHHQEVQPYVYNNWYLLFFLDDCLLSWLDWNNPTRTTGSHLKRIISSTSTCSGRTKAHHQEVQPYLYNNWYLLFFLDDCLLSWLDWNNPTRTTGSHLKRIILSTSTCSGHTKAHHQEVQPYVYNNWYLLFFLDDCLLSWLDCSNPTRTTGSHLKRIISSTPTCSRRTKAHHQEVQPYVCNNWYLLFFLDDCLLSWLDWNNPTRTTGSNLKRIISTNCYIHTVVPPDDGLWCARNM